jgi:hypothetical protein
MEDSVSALPVEMVQQVYNHLCMRDSIAFSRSCKYIRECSPDYLISHLNTYSKCLTEIRSTNYSLGSIASPDFKRLMVDLYDKFPVPNKAEFSVKTINGRGTYIIFERKYNPKTNDISIADTMIVITTSSASPVNHVYALTPKSLPWNDYILSGCPLGSRGLSYYQINYDRRPNETVDNLRVKKARRYSLIHQ